MSAAKKVLVVDDNPTNLIIVEEILGGEYRLKFAGCGGEAIRIAHQFQPAIILLDVMMPDLDGLEVCKRMRQLPGVSDAVIIMMSAKAMPSEQAEGLRAGADEYIAKPFDDVELLSLLRRHAGRSHQRESALNCDVQEARVLSTF